MVTDGQPFALVLEDDIEMARVLELALGEMGIAAWVCPTSERALDIIQQGMRPAIVLSDVWLPGMDGATLASQLKDDERCRDIPIVLISAVEEPAGHRADAFVAKPFDLDYLAQVLGRLLDKPSEQPVGQ